MKFHSDPETKFIDSITIAIAVVGLLILASALIGCGSVQEDYRYSDVDPGSMTVLYVPGLEETLSPIGSNEWNCGLRALALIREGAEAPWNPIEIEHQVANDLPIRDAFGWEGMSTKEVDLTAKRMGMRSRVYLSTAFDDLWDGVREGFPAVVLTQDGIRDNGVSEVKSFHWVAVVGVAQSADKARYLIVVAVNSGKRQLLPESDFRRLVWWDVGGVTDSLMTGSGTRPGTSIRLDTRHLVQ